MGKLLDYWGRLVKPKVLKHEYTGPSSTGVRTTWSADDLGILTPKNVASILKDAETPGYGSTARYAQLAEVMEERDLNYLGVLQTRRRQVAQIGVRIEPASDAATDINDADLATEFFERDTIEDDLFELLDAISKSYSVSEIIWDMSEKQWEPQRLAIRMPQWFDFDRDSGTRLLRLADDGGWAELEPYKFITHFSKAKSGLPIRGGLARCAAWGWLFKNYSIKNWVRFIEVYGHPLRIGKYHPGADLKDKKTLFKALKNIASDMAGIIPESMSVDFIQDSSVRGRSDIYKDFLEYIDQQIAIAVLGQTLTTQAGDKGSYALGQVHNLVRHDIETSDAKQLAATLRRDLVTPLIRLNNGPRKKYPKVIIERKKATDVKLIADTIATLAPFGFTARVEDVRAQLGLAAPGPDDEVLAAPKDKMVNNSNPKGTANNIALANTVLESSLLPDDTYKEFAGFIDAWLMIIYEQVTLDDNLDDLGYWLDTKSLYKLNTGPVSQTLGDVLIIYLLAGRLDVDKKSISLAVEESANVYFQEQIDFFRRKLNLPTATWTDIWQSQHDVAFVVAGAMRDELLSDFRTAVDSAIADGTTLETFRKSFDSIVAKHGWSYNGGRDWRTRVIYDTNLSTSYAAGRWQQLQAVKKHRPYWQYRHSHASVNPREHHLSWHGMVLHADDPWWHSNYPPNGWGCKCLVDALSERDLKKLGKSKPDTAPPLNRQEKLIGSGPRARVVRVPDGIDPGFAYAPGRVSMLGEVVQRRLQQSLKQSPIIAANGVSNLLKRSSSMGAVLANWKDWRGQDGLKEEVFEIGVVSPTVINALHYRKEIVPQTALVTLSRSGLAHLQRPSKQRGSALNETDLDHLPEIINQPQAVLYDTKQKGKHTSYVLLYVFDASDKKKGKVVVEVDYSAQLKLVGQPRKQITSNSVRTAGYVDTGNLREPRYIILDGEIEE